MTEPVKRRYRKDPTMPELFSGHYSPYTFYTANEWAEFGTGTPLTLSFDEVKALRAFGDPIDLREVERIYLSLSRLLSTHVESIQALYLKRQEFLQHKETVRTPFIIGIAGSVAVGKSTTARILQELLKRWPSSPKVDLVTTDGFLYPNEVLKSQNLMDRKGFPNSYNVGALLRFLSAIKAGRPKVKAPLYSHFTYDVLPGKYAIIDQPDILILEGVNVLQIRDLPRDGKVIPFVSDFFNFSIYLDADKDDVRKWYLSRFVRLRETAFQRPESPFHRYAQLTEAEALAAAEELWTKINLKNLEENIAPTRPRADLVLRKGRDHLIENVALRKL